MHGQLRHGYADPTHNETARHVDHTTDAKRPGHHADSHRDGAREHPASLRVLGQDARKRGHSPPRVAKDREQK